MLLFGLVYFYVAIMLTKLAVSVCWRVYMYVRLGVFTIMQPYFLMFLGNDRNTLSCRVDASKNLCPIPRV